MHTIQRIRKLALLASIGVLSSFGLAMPAHAQLAPIYNQLVNTLQRQVVDRAMAAMGQGIEGAVAQSGAATQGEIAKGAMVNKNVLEGLEAYRTEQDLRIKAAKTAEDLRQPATTCSTMAAQGGIGNARSVSQGRVNRDQTQVLARIRGNTNTVAALETSYAQSSANYCSEAEAAQNICVRPANAALAGADQNAAMLFQGSDASPTYTGGPDGAQSRAVEGYIGRVVAGLPPEQLRGVNYRSNPQGRAYVELMRRYSAVSSMSAYSLNQIKSGRVPQVGLGDSTSMANVEGFAAKQDMSMLEAVQRFVKTKFSAKSITDSMQAMSPNLILRDMAQMGAFQLWIEHQTLLQDSRSEALLAHQLALMTEQTLRPQLEAQRAAANRAVASAR